jgi:dephospho-CoA kinase
MGAGKSTVTRLLTEQGGHPVDADQLARAALAPGSRGCQLVLEWLGNDLRQADGSLNRSLLADRLGDDEQHWARLEAIIHPRVRHLQARLLRQLATRPHAGPSPVIALLDVPLLFESGTDQLCDCTVAVMAGEARAARLEARAGMNPAVRRVADRRQLPEAGKCRRADHVIDNRAPADAPGLHDQIAGLWQALVQAYTRRLEDVAIPRAWPERWQAHMDSFTADDF